MNRLSLFVVALALGLSASLIPRDARACSCVRPPPPAVALEQASAVFVGEVRAVELASDIKREITLDVVRAFKGMDEEQVTLSTPMSSAACGRNFEVGKRYIVYASRLKGELYDNLCSRTALVEAAQHDLEALDAIARGAPPPVEPKPAVEEREEQQTPPPSGAAEPKERPALEEGPSTQPSGAGEPRQPPADAPAGHCASTSGPTLLPLALVSLALLLRVRRRMNA